MLHPERLERELRQIVPTEFDIGVTAAAAPTLRHPPPARAQAHLLWVGRGCTATSRPAEAVSPVMCARACCTRPHLTAVASSLSHVWPRSLGKMPSSPFSATPSLTGAQCDLSCCDLQRASSHARESLRFAEEKGFPRSALRLDI
eukprot:2106093-Pleurochrysis_carterae.AAC.1